MRALKLPLVLVLVSSCSSLAPGLSAESGAVRASYAEVGEPVSLVRLQDSGAAPAPADEGELARKTQNPVSDLISLPFQNNANFDFGHDDDVQNILNVQPVIPMKLNEDWNLINRTIMPVVYQPEITPNSDSEFGLGDTSHTVFFSPADSGKVIWGAGPVALLPTASDDALGKDAWGLGPSVVALTMRGPWVVGAIASNTWGVGGSGQNDLNSFLFQYFVNYNMDDGWYLTSAPIITANWEADSDDRWVVPFGGGVGKIFKIGKRPLNAQLSYYYNVESPDIGPDWQIRLQVALLFPKG